MDSGDGSVEPMVAAVEQLVHYVRRRTTAGGLSHAAASTLTRLCQGGPRRLSELARSENVSQPSMTQLVSRMERAGLVRRAPDPDDGRGVLVTTTGLGVEVYRARKAERAAALQHLVARLPEEEQNAVRIALPALTRAIHEERASS